jgi:hypothetical protein
MAACEQGTTDTDEIGYDDAYIPAPRRIACTIAVDFAIIDFISMNSCQDPPADLNWALR